jgi:hypothetical protein
MKASDAMDQNTLSRRDFVRAASLMATAFTSGLALAPKESQAQPAANPSAPATPMDFSALGKPMIGFQVEVPYMLEYGIERFLDDVQARASVNTLFLHATLFAPSGDGQGAFAAAHPEYYHDTGLEPRGLSQGDYDLPGAMGKIRAATGRRGIKIFSWLIEDNRPAPKIRGMDRLYEIDLHGRRTQGHPGGPCLNNPYFQALLTGQVEDLIRSYGIDGLQRGSERQGPLGNALGAWHHGSSVDPGRTSCFCEYCTAKGNAQGINVERVRQGYLALEPYVRAGRAGQRPADGYYVEFWRLILRYPEILAWETLWADSMRENQRAVYAKAKSLRPDLPVGFHIWQNASFNPIYRAEQDYRPYLEYSDFLKPVLYDNPAAERMASYIYSVDQNIYGDLSREQALQFGYSVMGLTQEKTYDEIIGGPEAPYEAQLRKLPVNDTPRPQSRFALFSSDYVLRETQRAARAAAGSRTKIWIGLGIDVVEKNSTPASVRGAVQAVFQGGGTGLIISTSHAAMRPENLSAVGATLRELKLA